MVGILSAGEKPLDWVGSSKKDFLAFPEPVKDEMGNALGLAQFGGKHPSAKPWRVRVPVSSNWSRTTTGIPTGQSTRCVSGR